VPLHAVTRAPRVASPVPPLLVLLHGLGADEEDLLPVAAYLDPRLKVVSVRAPHEVQPMGHAWFAIDWSTQPPRFDLAQAERSREELVELLERAPAEHGTDPSRTFLFGFSQGAAMALAVAATRPELLRGAILHSGRAPTWLADRLREGVTLGDVELLVLHGVDDDVLPIANGRQIRDLLAPVLGPRLTYREHEAGHFVTGATLADAAR
jgi:phospholipase/carboxylesterase